MPSALDRYLFDVNGYLVLRAALSRDEIAALNGILDTQRGPVGAAMDRRYDLGTPLEWGQPFIDLLDHPSVFPYFTEWLGSGVRLDHVYPILAGRGAGEQGLHGGAVPHEPTATYLVKGGRIRSGLTVAAWALTDAPPGTDGGFACVPGSHKAEFPLPADLTLAGEHVTQVPVKAGDVVLFTEALTHGSFPWNHDHERRVLFYKYSPAPLAWAHVAWPRSVLERCTERQRLLLEPAYNWNGTLDAGGVGERGGLRRQVTDPARNFLDELVGEIQTTRSS